MHPYRRLSLGQLGLLDLLYRPLKDGRKLRHVQRLLNVLQRRQNRRILRAQ